MRLALISVAAFVLIGASPVEESEKLIEAGRGKDAVVLLEKAAQDGDAGAIDQLAWFYDQGKIVPQDLARAAILYRQAAEAGNSHAQWALGVMLDMGEGIKEDPVEAVKWFEKAADQGDRSAIVSLAVMHANGRGVAQDFAQARRFYLDAAKRGEPHAFFGMGLLYLKGQGVERDKVESLAWMWVASNLGDRQAKEALTEYGLSSSDTRAAAQRANMIANEFGFQNAKARFVDCDEDKEVADECAAQDFPPRPK